MKTNLITVLAFVSINILNAQKLVLTPNGLADSSDNSNKHIIIDVPNLTTSELYTNSVNYIQRTYKSPQDVIKGQVENSFMSFVTHTDKIATYSIPLNGNENIQADFMIDLKFKDGKVRFEVVNFEMYYYAGYSKVTFNINQEYSGWSIFNKKGEVNKKAETTKIEIERYFNDYISYLKEGLTGTQDSNDDW